MRNQFLASFFLMFVWLMGCSNDDGLTVPKRTIIAGHIDNAQIYKDSTQFILDVRDFGGMPTTRHPGIINQRGDFKIELEEYVVQDVSLKQEDLGNKPIIKNFIVHPGDSIYINMDYKNIKNVNFSGNGAKTNNDLFNYVNNYTTLPAEAPLSFLNFSDPEKYKEFCAANRVELLKKRNAFMGAVNPNDEVQRWAKNQINIHYYSSLANFQTRYNRNLATTPGSAPLGNYINFDKDDINEIYNAKLLNADSYALLAALLPVHDVTTIIDKYDDKLIAEIDKVAKDNNNPLLKQLLIGEIFYSDLAKKDAENFYKNREVLEANVQAQFILQPLVGNYEAVKNYLAKSNAFKATMINNLAGSPAQHLIDSIKSQNKGKVIYLDFWATWCSPCRAEMPNSEKLIEKYKGKDITLAFICIGSEMDKWKTSLKELNLTGSQYFCDKEQSQSFTKGFKIYGIPYYMLINKKGEIAYTTDMGSGGSLRPMDAVTQKRIEQLLN